jgi:hypothetical protein
MNTDANLVKLNISMFNNQGKWNGGWLLCGTKP